MEIINTCDKEGEHKNQCKKRKENEKVAFTYTNCTLRKEKYPFKVTPNKINI